MAAKTSKQLEITTKFGNKFTLQRVRASAWIDQTDKMTGSEKPNLDTMKYLLETVVVVPSGLTIDTFDDDDQYNGYAELLEVCDAAKKFQLNK